MPVPRTPLRRPAPSRPLTRRGLLTGGLAGAGLLLASCASPEGSEEAASTPSSSPGDPRVIDLADNVFDLATLGVVPVGTAYGADYLRPTLEPLGLDPAVVEQVLAAELVADSFVPDVEAILALEPDVVLTTEGYTGYYPEQLEVLRGATTVEVLPDADWAERTRALAEAVGRGEDGRARVAAVQERLARLTADVEAAGLAGTTVSLLRLFPPDQVYAFVPPSLAATIVADAGLVQPAVQLQAVPDAALPAYAAQAPFAQETLTDHDADVLLLGEAGEGDLEAFTAGPVASRLSAVQEGRVAAVPYFLWALSSAVGAEQIAADLEQHVLAAGRA